MKQLIKMTGKQITITPPEGYQVDTENSTFQCIKFKPIEKPKRWTEEEYANIKGYFISNISVIVDISSTENKPENYNVFATEMQAKSALAMARISQIMANDPRFGGVVTDEEWMSSKLIKYVIDRVSYEAGDTKKIEAFQKKLGKVSREMSDIQQRSAGIRRGVMALRPYSASDGLHHGQFFSCPCALQMRNPK